MCSRNNLVIIGPNVCLWLLEYTDTATFAVTLNKTKLMKTLAALDCICIMHFNQHLDLDYCVTFMIVNFKNNYEIFYVTLNKESTL